MSFQVSYHELVVREDLPKLDGRIKKRIRHAIETRLMLEPELYGAPLRRSLAGYRKLRVGDYRIVFKIMSTKVRILIIEHRSVAYEKVLWRLS